MDLNKSASASAAALGGITLAQAQTNLEQLGFEGQLSAREASMVLCHSCHEELPASELAVDQIIRVEGTSDPEEMAAVVAAQCPRCSARGTLTLMYGPLAPAEESDVLEALRDPTQASPELVE